MKFTSENAKDIEKYFLNSFMKFPSFSGDIVHYVDSVSSQYVRGRLWTGEEEEEFEFKLRSDGPEVEFILPVKSFFMHEGNAHFLTRTLARQYRRGVCSENTNIHRLTEDGFHPVGLNFKVLSSYVGKQAFPSLAMFKGDCSIALSPRIAVSQNGRLYIDRNDVGSVDTKTKQVALKEKLFVPELQALVNAAPGWKIAEAKAPAKPRKSKKISEKYGVDDEGNVVELEMIDGEL